MIERAQSASHIEQSCAGAQAGRVIWITGLSGAGKTTVATHLRPLLQARGLAVIILDGDELRTVFPLGDRFDGQSRLVLALAYGRLCRVLAQQGFTVICATISMRREVYAWNRENLPNYFEIFLDAPLAVRSRRDPKEYYSALGQGTLTDFSGYDVGIDLPERPHMHVRAARDETPAEIAGRIADLVVGKDPQEARASL